MSQSIYQYVETLCKKKFAFIDIDGTLTAHPWDSKEKDLLDKDLTNQAVQTLQDHGYMCIPTTSCTEEMCMSEAQYELSKKNGFTRPPPHMGGGGNNMRFYVKPEDIFPKKVLDLPIIISSSGAQIAVLQKNGGYILDDSFYPKQFPDPHLWRKQTISFLSTIDVSFSYGEIESEEAYKNGETDIFPANYRIQLLFSCERDILRLSEVVKNTKLYLTNDSHPDKNAFVAYITPKNGKIDAINHVVDTLQGTGAEILIIGDSLPDLEAGLNVKIGPQSHLTFFLVGGSRLSSYPLPPSSVQRSIVYGDILFPGAIGPRSIIEFLAKKGYNEG